MTKKTLTLLALLSTVLTITLSCQSVTEDNSGTDKTDSDANKTVTITFNVNGGNETAPEKISVSASTTVKLPSLKAENFLHWNTKADGSGNSYQKNGSYHFTNSVTLYAIYRKTDETVYTVTLYTRDGILLSALSVPAGQTIPQNELSQFTGDSFIGWFDIYGNSFEPSAKITENIALYAYYQEESSGEDPGWEILVSFPDEGCEIDKTAVRIEVPEGVTNIRNHAFEGCENLQEVVLPSTLKFIGDYAFAGCTSLTSIEIPENTYSIGDLHGHVFEKSGISSITMPKNADLRSYLFNECENLVEVIFPDDAYITGELTFYNCPKLTSITVPEGITRVRATTCESLAKVKLSSTTVKDINFFECAIEEIEIPEGVEEAGFTKCEKLRKVTLPKSVKKMGAYLSTNITEVHYTGDAGDWCNVEFEGESSHPFNNQYSDETKLLYLNGVLAEDIVIPDGIENISNYAFFNCKSIKSVTIPDSVTRIGVYAFASSTITSVNIPKSVTKIGNFAFAWCANLKKLSISKNSSPFDLDYNTEERVYEDIDTDCGEVFRNDFLDEVYFDGNIADWFNSYELFVGSLTDSRYYYFSTTNLYLNGVLAEDIVIPDGVTHIPGGVFNYNKSIKSIKIPSSVKVIGKCAFYSCANLTDVTFNEGLELIEDQAFLCCTNLKSIVIPNSVTRIESESSVFHPNGTFGASGLVSAVVGDGLSEIEYELFWGCENLVSVKLGKNVKRIGARTFDTCKALKEVIIPDSCEFIDWGAFFDCISLEEITLPKSLKTISPLLFSGCKSLKRLDIPEGVTRVESGEICGPFEVHYQYSPGHYESGILEEIVFPASLEHIESSGLCVTSSDYSFTFLGSEPPIIDPAYYTNYYCPKAIYVPDEALEAYRTSELKFWKHWANDGYGPLLPLSQKPSASD